MATITRYGDKWRAQVCVDGHRKSKVCDTKAQAKQWASEAESILGKLASGTSVTHTLGDVFYRYAAEISETKRGAQWEIVRLKKFQRHDIANIRLIDLRRESIEVWRDEQLQSLKGSSVNRELNLLSNCLTWARRWRWMQDNPMQDLQRPKNPKHRERRISPGEIEAILLALNYAGGCSFDQSMQRVGAAFLFAIETAMRAGEICSLTWVNVKGAVAHLPETKNGTARDVPLSKTAIAIIESMPATGDLVFNLDSGTLSTLFRRYSLRSGVENITFHDTRHEAITRLAKKLDVLSLARAVGHKDIKQLMTYYNETADEMAKLLD